MCLFGRKKNFVKRVYMNGRKMVGGAFMVMLGMGMRRLKEEEGNFEI